MAAPAVRLRLGVALLSLTTMLGACCSRPDGRLKVYPVRGQVFVNGKPAAGATVFLHPLGQWDTPAMKPNGKVEADGSFRLSTYVSGDGAPAGDYAVTVRWGKLNPLGGKAGPNKSPGRYSDPKTSMLRARVKEVSNELEPFRLTR